MFNLVEGGWKVEGRSLSFSRISTVNGDQRQGMSSSSIYQLQRFEQFQSKGNLLMSLPAVMQQHLEYHIGD